MKNNNNENKHHKIIKKQHIKIVLLDCDEYIKVRQPTDTLKGRTTFKKPDKDDISFAIIQAEKFDLLKPKKNNKKMYYTQLDDKTKWVQYEDKKKPLFLLLLLILLGVLLFKLSDKPIIPPENNYSLNDLLRNNGGNSTNSSIPSFNQLYVGKDDTIPFVNLSSNEWNMKYEVFDSNNKKVFETKVMEPGEESQWDIHSYYKHKTGSYQFVVKTILINPKNGENGNSQTFNATIDLQ